MNQLDRKPITQSEFKNRILSIKREFNHKIDNLLEIVTNEFDELKGGVESPIKLSKSEKRLQIEKELRERFAKF